MIEKVINGILEGLAPELTDEQLEPFKELIKEPMNEIKAKYGKDACEAFGIDTEGVKFSN